MPWGGKQRRWIHLHAYLGGRNDEIFHLFDIGEDDQTMATKFARAYNEVYRRHDALQLTKQVVQMSKRVKMSKRTLREEHPDTLDWIHILVT